MPSANPLPRLEEIGIAFPLLFGEGASGSFFSRRDLLAVSQTCRGCNSVYSSKRTLIIFERILSKKIAALESNENKLRTIAQSIVPIQNRAIIVSQLNDVFKQDNLANSQKLLKKLIRRRNDLSLFPDDMWVVHAAYVGTFMIVPMMSIFDEKMSSRGRQTLCLNAWNLLLALVVFYFLFGTRNQTPPQHRSEFLALGRMGDLLKVRNEMLPSIIKFRNGIQSLKEKYHSQEAAPGHTIQP